MDDKTKELIAIGASVSAHCQPCVTYHVAKAKELGIGEELILDAIAVGQRVEKGAGSIMREFTQGLFAAPSSEAGCSSGKNRPEAPAVEARCHCG